MKPQLTMYRRKLKIVLPWQINRIKISPSPSCRASRNRENKEDQSLFNSLLHYMSQADGECPGRRSKFYTKTFPLCKLACKIE